MGFFLWGVALGWAAGAQFYYSQTQDEKAANSAALIFCLLFISAAVISISLGVSSGAIVSDIPPATPTYEGR